LTSIRSLKIGIIWPESLQTLISSVI
jgi:hypothetical protein